MIMARNKDWTENESEMSGGGSSQCLGKTVKDHQKARGTNA